MKWYFSRLRQNGRGMTLVEILAVFSIITILSGVLYASLTMVRARSRDAIRIKTFEEFSTALGLYYEQYDMYPCGDSVSVGAHFDGSSSCPFLDGNAGSASDSNYNGCMPPHSANPVCQTPTFGLYSGPQKYYPVFDFRDNPYTKYHRYVYTASLDRQKYLIQTSLEVEKDKMQNDGGLCNNRYERGTGVGDPTLTFVNSVWEGIACN